MCDRIRYLYCDGAHAWLEPNQVEVLQGTTEPTSYKDRQRKRNNNKRTQVWGPKKNWNEEEEMRRGRGGPH